MTRINAGIKPEELPNKLLLAELREIKRVPNCISKNKYNLNNMPTKFKLGTGHVKFFYDKLLFLKKRYISLKNEAINRSFNVQDFSNAWDNIPENLMNDYAPNNDDRRIILNRFKEKGHILITDKNIKKN